VRPPCAQSRAHRQAGYDSRQIGSPGPPIFFPYPPVPVWFSSSPAGCWPIGQQHEPRPQVYRLDAPLCLGGVFSARPLSVLPEKRLDRRQDLKGIGPIFPERRSSPQTGIKCGCHPNYRRLYPRRDFRRVAVFLQSSQSSLGVRCFFDSNFGSGRRPGALQRPKNRRSRLMGSAAAAGPSRRQFRFGTVCKGVRPLPTDAEVSENASLTWGFATCRQSPVGPIFSHSVLTLPNYFSDVCQKQVISSPTLNRASGTSRV